MRQVYLDYSLGNAINGIMTPDATNITARRINALTKEADYAEVRGEFTTSVPIGWVEDSLEVIERCTNPVADTNEEVRRWNVLANYYEDLVIHYEPIPQLLAEAADFTGALTVDDENEDWGALDASLVFFSQSSQALSDGRTEDFCNDDEEATLKPLLTTVIHETPQVFDDEIDAVGAIYRQARDRAHNGEDDFELDIDQVKLISSVFERMRPTMAGPSGEDDIARQVANLEEGLWEYEIYYENFIYSLREAAQLFRSLPADFLANYDIDQLKLAIWLDKIDALRLATEMRGGEVAN